MFDGADAPRIPFAELLAESRQPDVPLVAFHGDPAIKAYYLARVAEHRHADEIAQAASYYSREGGRLRCCAIGCTIHSGSHRAYERELGIPHALAWLEDVIFEALPEHLALLWPGRFLEAIEPGRDLSTVAARFYLWLITEETPPPDMPDAVREACGLVELRAKGRKIPREAFTDTIQRLRMRQAAIERAAPCKAGAMYIDAMQRLMILLRDNVPMSRDTAGILRNMQGRRDTMARTRSLLRMSEKLLALLADAPRPSVM